MSTETTPYVAWTARSGFYYDKDGAYVRRQEYDRVLALLTTVMAHEEETAHKLTMLNQQVSDVLGMLQRRPRVAPEPRPVLDGPWTSQLRKAEMLAHKAHAGQTEASTGEPYVHHLKRVAALVTTEAQETVAWLHDILEDTSMTLAELRGCGFDDEICDAVDVLTRQKHAETYAVYIERVRRSNSPLALSVKIADLCDHLRPGCPPRLRSRYLAALAWLWGIEHGQATYPGG